MSRRTKLVVAAAVALAMLVLAVSAFGRGDVVEAAAAGIGALFVGAVLVVLGVGR